MKVSLHIEQGFPDPLLNCLRLQRALRGIKRTQSSPAACGLPVTDSIMDIMAWVGHVSLAGAPRIS